MELIEQENLHVGKHFFIHCINQHPINHIYDGFPWDMFAETCANNRDKQIIVVLDAHTEGPSWQHIKTTVERMTAEFGINPHCIIQWTGSGGEGGEPIQVVSVMDAFSIITAADKCTPQPINHHYIMLARIPRPHRVLIAVEILQRGLGAFGYLSCGSGSHGPLVSSDFADLVPADLIDRFPLLLPGGYWSDSYGEREHTDSVTLPEITGAFCNVIAETSHDLMSPNVCTAFMTEKSEKCFLLEQVPIWVAATGQAKLAREWGFDLFDDLIDHSYDLEPDGRLRIKMAADQLEKLCAQSIGQLQEFKRLNQQRFTANRELCFYLRKNHHDIQYEKFKGCVNAV